MQVRNEVLDTDVFLTICIPTFNRSEKTSILVQNLLSYKSNDFQVLVLDNCSTDNTAELLAEIDDHRFVFQQNIENIGGMVNILKSLTLGVGTYSLLCLDKDTLIAENIGVLIKHIKQDTEVVVGQCALNSEEFNDDVIYSKALDSLLHIAYTSEHPSGLFLKKDVLIEAGIIDKIIEKDGTFAFNPELVKAELSIIGKSKRINIPFVQTETLEECAKTLSHTYKNTNLYFLPQMVINRFNSYTQNLYSLNLSVKEKRFISIKIFATLLASATIGYKSIMKNESICTHHGIHTKKISMKDMAISFKDFNENFIRNFDENWFGKIIILVSVYSDIIYKTILKATNFARR
jgi:glycosyltransferase involved in cell wall biosynthesis